MNMCGCGDGKSGQMSTEMVQGVTETPGNATKSENSSDLVGLLVQNPGPGESAMTYVASGHLLNKKQIYSGGKNSPKPNNAQIEAAKLLKVVYGEQAGDLQSKTSGWSILNQKLNPAQVYKNSTGKAVHNGILSVSRIYGETDRAPYNNVQGAWLFKSDGVEFCVAFIGTIGTTYAGDRNGDIAYKIERLVTKKEGEETAEVYTVLDSEVKGSSTINPSDREGVDVNVYVEAAINSKRSWKEEDGLLKIKQ